MKEKSKGGVGGGGGWGVWLVVWGSYLSSVLCAQLEVHTGPLVPCEGDSRGGLDDKEAPGVLYGEWGI